MKNTMLMLAYTDLNTLWGWKMNIPEHSLTKCPLNQLQPCVGMECPLYNRKLECCLLPRAVLATIQNASNTRNIKEMLNEDRIKEKNYGKTRQN